MQTEALRDWIYAFFDVTYCNAPWVADAEPEVHIEGQSQCKKESPRFDAACATYLATTLPTQLSLFSNLITKLPGMGAEGGAQGPQGTQTQGAQAQTHTQGPKGPWLLGYLTFVDFILAEYLMQHLLFRYVSYLSYV
jgi:hypothetical protein